MICRFFLYWHALETLAHILPDRTLEFKPKMFYLGHLHQVKTHTEAERDPPLPQGIGVWLVTYIGELTNTKNE